MRSLIIDNYDSYTYNLYQMIAEINNQEPVIIKNNEFPFEALGKINFDNIIISPGPGTPLSFKDFGICERILREIDVPILGVCLGHQGISSAYGGKVIHAKDIMHGRISKVLHNGDILFTGVPSGFAVVRYHSLVVNSELPFCLKKTAWTDEGVIMGIRHKEKPIWGVQFHPESICTEYGEQILKNFKDITNDCRKKISMYCENNQNSKTGNASGCSKVKYEDIGENVENDEFVVRVRKLAFYPEPQITYKTLFGHCKEAIWLDSSMEIEGYSNFSFMGAREGPYSRLIRYDVNIKELIVEGAGNKKTYKNISIFDYLKDEIKKRRCVSTEVQFNFNCGFVGYLGYELKEECTSIKGLNTSNQPDAMFLFLDRIVVFDHVKKECYLLCYIGKGEEDLAEKWFSEIENKLNDKIVEERKLLRDIKTRPVFYLSRDKEQYTKDIKKCLNYIKDGETYEVCLTNKINADININPFEYYLNLRKLNPAPYSVFMQFDNLCIASSSIERFIYVDREGFVETKPIKGTLRRGRTYEEDNRLKLELERDEKSRAENLMIVDLLRNDLGITCEIGSIHVPNLMNVESYETVHQLVSTIRGKLKKKYTAVDCVRHSFPGGSMTGAPKLRTMEIIDSLETEARGIYAGAIGYFALNGAADFNIVIRTAVIEKGKVSIGVGGAITAMSEIESEFEEILLKGESLIRAMDNKNINNE